MSQDPPPALARLPALDGLRGLLAVVVVLWHATAPLGLSWFTAPAQFAVFGFFVLSGLVLARGWDGRPLAFLAQRLVRLWPTYALCLALGFLIAGAAPDGREFLFFPLLTPDAAPHIDPPVWSLIVEAWAMPAMPLIVWLGRASLARAWAGAATACGVGHFVGDPQQEYFLALGYFILGAHLSRYSPRLRWLEARPAQWLGKISYSLYLSHWLVFALAARLGGPIGALCALPLAFLVGWALWATVEQPSVNASRRLKSWLARPRLAPLVATP
ncbi:MAG: acyltransferase [Pseudomonadota bacterium]|nr:acyltransferase [Pseudomonadota bacterium]